MITAIRTHNFKKLENFSANFSNGTNLIVGENAQGKSTSLDAIRFALFGSKGVSGTVPSLTTWGKSGMWVELDISGFTINRTSQNAKITDKDGKLVASGNSTCAKFCEDLLGCSVKDFDLLYMSKQNETAGLITFGATELNRKVEEYAGVAKIDKVVKSLGSQINGLQIALQSLQVIQIGDLGDEMDNLRLKVRSFEEQEDTLTKKAASTKKPLSELSIELSEIKSFNDLQDKLAQSIASHQQKLDRAEATLKERESQLKSATEKLALVNEVSGPELAELRQDIAKVRNAYDKLNRLKTKQELDTQIAKAQQKACEYETYAEKLTSLEKEVKLAGEAFEATKDLLSESNIECSKHASEINNAKKELDSGICSGCNRPFEGHDHESAKSKLKEAEQFYAEALKVREARTADQREANRLLTLAKDTLASHMRSNPGSDWEDRVAELKEELESVTEQRRSIEAVIAKLPALQDLEQKLETLVSDQTLYQSAHKLWADTSSAYNKAKDEFDLLDEQELEKPSHKKPTDEVEMKINEANSLLNNLNAELSSTRVSLANDRAELKGKVSQYEAAKANNQKVSELSEELDTCKQLRSYLNEERGKFMNGVWRTILGTASHFINKSTSGWITNVGRDDKGDFTFTENGNVAVAKESASGAQKAFIGTAIKVGLAQAKMGSSSMVILDEPTADMRDDKAAWLAAGLMMLPGQKIMVTHRDSERMVAQNIVYVGE